MPLNACLYRGMQDIALTAIVVPYRCIPAFVSIGQKANIPINHMCTQWAFLPVL